MSPCCSADYCTVLYCALKPSREQIPARLFRGGCSTCIYRTILLLLLLLLCLCLCLCHHHHLHHLPAVLLTPPSHPPPLAFSARLSLSVPLPLHPPPPEPVSTHELSRARTADPSVLAGQRRRQRPGRAQCAEYEQGGKLEACPSRRAAAAAAAAAVPRSKPSPAQPSQPVCSICLHDALDPSPACVANPIPTHASEPTAWSSPRHDWYRVSHNRNEQQHAQGPAHAPAAPIICALASPTPYHTSPPPAPTRARLIRPPAPSRHPLAACSLHLASDSTAAPPSLRFALTQAWGRNRNRLEETPTRALHKPL